MPVATLEDCKINLICHFIPIYNVGITGINSKQSGHVAEFRGCLHRILCGSLRLFFIHERERPCFAALFPDDRLTVRLNVNVVEWSERYEVPRAVLSAILGKVRAANSAPARLPVIVEANLSTRLFERVAVILSTRIAVMRNLEPDNLALCLVGLEIRRIGCDSIAHAPVRKVGEICGNARIVDLIVDVIGFGRFPSPQPHADASDL